MVDARRPDHPVALARPALEPALSSAVTDADALVSLAVSLGDWLLVDGQMDNTFALNAHGFTDGEDRDVARRARAIRETGWEVTGPILQPLVPPRRLAPVRLRAIPGDHDRASSPGLGTCHLGTTESR